MTWLLDLADRVWPDWLIVLWGLAAIALGTTFVISAAFMAVRHYGFGRPVRSRDTQEPVSAREAAVLFATFCGGGGMFLVLGLLAHDWKAG